MTVVILLLSMFLHRAKYTEKYLLCLYVLPDMVNILPVLRSFGNGLPAALQASCTQLFCKPKILFDLIAQHLLRRHKDGQQI